MVISLFGGKGTKKKGENQKFSEFSFPFVPILLSLSTQT